MGYYKSVGQYMYITRQIFISILKVFHVNKIHEYEMVLTMRIICLVGKINIPLPTSKEGHECGAILMADCEREQFGRFLCLLGSRQNKWLNSIPIDVKTHEDIINYLDSHVKEYIYI